MLHLNAVGVESGRESQQTAVPKMATPSAAASPAGAPTPIPSDAGKPAEQREAENEMNSSTQSLVPEAASHVIKHADSGPGRSRGGGKVDVVQTSEILTSSLSPDSIAPQELEAAAGRDSESRKHLERVVQVGLKSHLAACSGKSWRNLIMRHLILIQWWHAGHIQSEAAPSVVRTTKFHAAACIFSSGHCSSFARIAGVW